MTNPVYVRLFYEDEAAALEWLTRVFGCKETARARPHPRRRHPARAETMPWGDRRYETLDLEGHWWHFAQRLDP